MKLWLRSDPWPANPICQEAAKTKERKKEKERERSRSKDHNNHVKFVDPGVHSGLNKAKKIASFR